MLPVAGAGALSGNEMAGNAEHGIDSGPDD